MKNQSGPIRICKKKATYLHQHVIIIIIIYHYCWGENDFLFSILSPRIFTPLLLSWCQQLLAADINALVLKSLELKITHRDSESIITSIQQIDRRSVTAYMGTCSAGAFISVFTQSYTLTSSPEVCSLYLYLLHYFWGGRLNDCFILSLHGTVKIRTSPASKMFYIYIYCLTCKSATQLIGHSSCLQICYSSFAY